MTELTNGVSEAIERLYDLNVGVVGHDGQRHERPHKPVMLLAVLDMVALGEATAQCVPWNENLRTRFAKYFSHVKQFDDRCTPDYPFFHLRGDEWWQPLRRDGHGGRALENNPTAADARAGTVFARLTSPMAAHFSAPNVRGQLREAIVARYFAAQRAELVGLFADGPVEGACAAALDELANEPQDPVGRNRAFRRRILDIYDCQCTACGLRIKMPHVEGLTFVDAAHLIPFGLSHNDHPSNGIALCKNHHWAMDRHLIAPTPDRVWQVSPVIEPRRSPGEKALADLAGNRLLLGKDAAYHPSAEALRWRVEHLRAATIA